MNKLFKIKYKGKEHRKKIRVGVGQGKKMERLGSGGEIKGKWAIDIER